MQAGPNTEKTAFQAREGEVRQTSAMGIGERLCRAGFAKTNFCWERARERPNRAPRPPKGCR